MTAAETIRPAGKRDVPAIRAIADATGLFPSDMVDDMIAGNFDGSKRDIWFVCDPETGAVAFGFCEPERMTDGTWNLLAIGVHPDSQGAWIGSAMMAYLENRLAVQGQRILLVETMGIAEFDRTRSFHRKIGYTEEARIREFHEAGADKIVYWKHL